MEKITRALLVRWQMNAKRSQIANYKAANYHSTLNYTLGIPALIISAIVGTSIFVTLQSNVELWAKILVGILNILVAVLSSLQTFFRSEERAAKHRSCAVEYGAVKRLIDELLSGGDISDDSLHEKIKRVRERLDDLSREGPIMPEKIWQTAKKTIPLAGASKRKK